MLREDIFNRVRQIIMDTLGVTIEEVKYDTLITNELSADSLDMVELTMNIESEFNLSIPDAQAEMFSTPRSIVQYIDSVFSTENEEVAERLGPVKPEDAGMSSKATNEPD